ncbi:hypothetical protein Vadar_021483 [Vaccinium darrowii]|uniref:Uncharacterized protein n=1 Tax=Vaccinium darrowii TaxID=229202 RepID=A0ACB7Y1G9_9ERIC|nr:hypothetical protein Vadar_021483 [Vaccinium darrowii]
MNVKNLEGATALDIAERLAPGSARTEIISILRRARASKSSSLDHDCSLVDFFTLRESWMETIFRFFVFVREGMSMEMRNVILVVAVLITTATFQAVLSPPGGSGVCSGGLSDDSSLFANTTMSMSSTSRLPITNISHINAAIFTSTKKLPKLFLAFYAMNTVSFIASIAMIILVLPFHVFAPLHASLMFLTLSYGFSFLFLPPMRDFGLIFAPSVIVIAFLFYTVHLVHDMIEYRLKIHKGLLFTSYLKKNRLRMLYRVALD